MINYFYVSAISGSKKYLVADPYPTETEARCTIKKALHIADKKDPRAWFMSWGTAGSDKEIKTILGVI